MRSGQPSPPALLVAAVASAAAAVIVHTLWPPGTVAGAAVTPVLVTLFDELLSRPAEHLSRAARERIAVRPRARWWRAVATGIAAFAIGATALTCAELALHRSVGDRHERTTLLGGPQTRPTARTTPACADRRPKASVGAEPQRPTRAQRDRRRVPLDDSPKRTGPPTTPAPTPPPAQDGTPTVTSTTPAPPPSSPDGPSASPAPTPAGGVGGSGRTS
jgi:hypothetical protein